MDFKNIVSTVITTIKADEAKVKEFIDKALPIVEDIIVDASDILLGKTPPSTGVKAVDDILAVLAILAPYYKGVNETLLQQELQAALAFLQGASAVI